MAKKKKRGKRKFTIPLAVVGGLAAGFLRTGPAGHSIIDGIMAGDINMVVYDGREILTGFDNKGNFHLDWLTATYGPVVLGLLIHKFLGGWPLNLNRQLAAAGVPFIRV